MRRTPFLKTIRRRIILFNSLFIRGVFIFCRVTENEPKEHVQKPTVSKDFPYAKNATGGGVFRAPTPSDLPTRSVSSAASDCLTARRLGFCSACPGHDVLSAPWGDKVLRNRWRFSAYGGFLIWIMNGFAVCESYFGCDKVFKNLL